MKKLALFLAVASIAVIAQAKPNLNPRVGPALGGGGFPYDASSNECTYNLANNPNNLPPCWGAAQPNTTGATSLPRNVTTPSELSAVKPLAVETPPKSAVEMPINPANAGQLVPKDMDEKTSWCLDVNHHWYRCDPTHNPL